MKKTLSTLLALMLILCLCVSMLPFAVSAEGEEESAEEDPADPVYFGDTDVAAVSKTTTQYFKQLGTGAPDQEFATSSYYNIAFDPVNRILELNGAYVTSLAYIDAEEIYGIYVPTGDITINLIGDNVINLADLPADSDNIGIYVPEGDIIFTGSGTLTIRTGVGPGTNACIVGETVIFGTDAEGFTGSVTLGLAKETKKKKNNSAYGIKADDIAISGGAFDIYAKTKAMSVEPTLPVGSETTGTYSGQTFSIVPPPSATVDDVKVDCATGSELEATDIVLTFSSKVTGVDTTDVASWFTNAPEGLTFTAVDTVVNNAVVVTVTVTGTPAAEKSEAIAITLPAGSVQVNGSAYANAVSVTANDSAKWNVYKVVPHAVELAEIEEGGTADVDKAEAYEGDTVCVTVNPAENYEIKSVVVTKESGGRCSVSASADNEYSFTMPSVAVTVKVTYKALAGASSAEESKTTEESKASEESKVAEESKPVSESKEESKPAESEKSSPVVFIIIGVAVVAVIAVVIVVLKKKKK